MQKSKVGLGDIARDAGVSTATVSRVLNDSGYVAPETRRAVAEAIERLGYVANGAARALASRRTRTIGALVPSFDNAISSQTVGAFQAAIEEAGYVLLLAASGYDRARARRNVEAMVARGVDAMLIITVLPDPDLHALLERHRIPFVTTMPNAEPDPVPFVGYDHRLAGRRIADFMLALGHRDVVIVRSQVSRSARLGERVAAIEKCFESAPDTRLRILEVPATSLTAGRDAFRELQALGSLPTGVIASNDVLAAGIIMECNRQGLRIPEQLSVIGYGDMDIAEHITPALTTVRTPKTEIGSKSADFLLKAIAGTLAPSVELEATITVRETTGAIRRSGG